MMMKRLFVFSVLLAASAFAHAGEAIYFVPTFGGTGAAGFNLNPSLLDQGHVVSRQRMEKGYAAGSRRFMVHLPMGRNQSDMMLTDTIDAAFSPDPRVRSAAASFVPQMAIFLHDHPGTQLYIYLGSPTLDGVFRVTGQIDPDEQAQLWAEAISPVLELSYMYPQRVGLALDHSHQVKPDDPVAKLMLATHRQLGVPLMVEGGVSVAEWQAEAGFARMMIWTTFKANLDKPLPNWPGEQVLLCNTAAQYSRQHEGWRQDMEARGFTVSGY